MVLAADTGLVVVEVTGADRISHLDAVTTQRFQGVPPGSVRGWLVLDGKGAPLAVGWALVDHDRILLLAPPPAAEHLLDVVAARTFLADVHFTPQDRPTVSVGGPDLSDALVAAGLDPAPDRWQRHDEVLVAHHAFGVEVVGTEDAATVFPAVTAVEPDELHVARGEPRFGHEVASGRLPEEYGLLATHVHLAKGCYPGQEPIAHMWMLGRPRRRLVRLDPVGEDRIHALGDGAVDEGPPINHASVDVTARARGGGLGWARPDVETGTPVAADLVVAGVVGDQRDVVGWSPAQTRRRDRGDSAAPLPRRRP